MRLLTKTQPLLLIALLAASSLISVETASAQTTPKPSIPEFTISVIDHTYDVQTTTTTTDPYDGHISTTTTPGYHMVNGSIEISIKNQPFTPYYASNGYPIKLFYHIRAQGFDANSWYYLPGEGSSGDYLEASNSSQTTITLIYNANCFGPGMGTLINYKADGTVDFQVEAFIGFKNVTRIGIDLVPRPWDFLTQFVGQTSGWSNTQTATIPNGAYTPIIPTPLPTQQPTPNPTVPHLTLPPVTNSSSTISINYSISLPLTAVVIIITALISVIVAMAVLLVYMKKKGSAKHA
jgi:hypothetical protein